MTIALPYLSSKLQLYDWLCKLPATHFTMRQKHWQRLWRDFGYTCNTDNFFPMQRTKYPYMTFTDALGVNRTFSLLHDTDPDVTCPLVLGPTAWDLGRPTTRRAHTLR